MNLPGGGTATLAALWPAALTPSLSPRQFERWEAQREAGTFAGPVPGEKEGGH